MTSPTRTRRAGKRKPLAIYDRDDLDVMARRGAAVARLPERMRGAAVDLHLARYGERLIADFALPPDQLALAVGAIRAVLEKALAEALQAKRAGSSNPALLALAAQMRGPA